MRVPALPFTAFTPADDGRTVVGRDERRARDVVGPLKRASEVIVDDDREVIADDNPDSSRSAWLAANQARPVEGPDLQPILKPVVRVTVGVEEDRIGGGTPDLAEQIAVQGIVRLAQAVVERGQLVAIPRRAAVEDGLFAEAVSSVYSRHGASVAKIIECWPMSI